MGSRRLFQVWLGLVVSSSKCTEALSVQHFHGRHQTPPRRSLPHLMNGRHLLSNNNNGLCMSKSSSTETTKTSWNKLTVPQLKSQLKELNLPVSGVKSELVRRLEEHEASLSSPENSANNNEPSSSTSGTKKRSISFPPPKDETEIQVLEKEVHETVRMLDSLKLGGNTASGGNGSSSDASSAPPTTKMSRQQKQQKELMDSLKEELKRSQQQKSSQSTSASSSSASSSAKQTSSAVTTPEQAAKAQTLQHYIEQLRLRPANVLKEELNSLRLSSKGRKPDLVQRLAKYYVARDADGYDDDEDEDEEDYEIDVELPTISKSSSLNLDRPVSFAGIPKLSANAANALHQAFGGDQSLEPSPIQAVAVPKLFYPPNPSALLHAPTGSGKTIAYLLPITETLWKEVEDVNNDNIDPNDMANGMALVLLPTRELAAQVAGVATVLAPPGMVRLVPRPMDLMGCWKDEIDRGEEFEYLEKEGNDAEGDDSNGGRRYQPRILVGSAKSISTSLFGDKKMPGTPTSKPEGKALLSSTRWLVMDEVDRLLNVKTSRTDKKSRRHEKPAALLSAAVARLTLGRVQVIAASATVGRPLRRELSRVLGLHSSECPETLRGEEDTAKLKKRIKDDETHIGRAVRIPNTVRNYVLPVDGSTSGSLLTSAAFASKTLLQPIGNAEASSRRVLIVLTRNCDIKVHNALGALRHFGIQPEPQSLLDALEADGTDRLVEAHRKVSGVEGVGGAKQRKTMDSDDDDEGYLLVTHEDNVRGLHLDGLDAVIVVGRPGSPDEYTHIAGRTGRAGRRGSVLNIVSYEQAAALSSWTKMLGVDFLPVDENEVAGVL